MVSLIHDESLVDSFYTQFLAPLVKDQVYFVSLSARNKYLDEEERRRYDLGRTEMFSREVVRDVHDWRRTFRRLEANAAAYRTRTGLELPQQALVVYANVNPSSMLRAYTSFCAEMNQCVADWTLSIANGKESNIIPLTRMDRTLLNHVQRSTAEKHQIDLDLDTDNYSLVDELLSYLQDVKYLVVNTKGGYHVLINRESLNLKDSKFKKGLYQHLIPNLHSRAKEGGGEVVVNKNGMVPVPGTFQGEHKVTAYEGSP